MTRQKKPDFSESTPTACRHNHANRNATQGDAKKKDPHLMNFSLLCPVPTNVMKKYYLHLLCLGAMAFFLNSCADQYYDSGYSSSYGRPAVVSTGFYGSSYYGPGYYRPTSLYRYGYRYHHGHRVCARCHHRTCKCRHHRGNHGSHAHHNHSNHNHHAHHGSSSNRNHSSHRDHSRTKPTRTTSRTEPKPGFDRYYNIQRARERYPVNHSNTVTNRPTSTRVKQRATYERVKASVSPPAPRKSSSVSRSTQKVSRPSSSSSNSNAQSQSNSSQSHRPSRGSSSRSGSSRGRRMN